jgi:prepilin-type N-terminal cleavage/methylation domain-containing protein
LIANGEEKKMKNTVGLKKMKSKESGFTLIELLFTMLLVLLALLLMSNVIIRSIDGNKKSYIRFQLSQELESGKNRLLSKPFDSEELKNGCYAVQEKYFKIVRSISSLSPTLKIIKLSISYKTLTRQIFFYKSRYIKEVYND